MAIRQSAIKCPFFASSFHNYNIIYQIKDRNKEAKD